LGKKIETDNVEKKFFLSGYGGNLRKELQCPEAQFFLITRLILLKPYEMMQLGT